MSLKTSFLVFFFNDTATTEIYTLSLHDALPIWKPPDVPPRPHPGSALRRDVPPRAGRPPPGGRRHPGAGGVDRKSTRLNSSHLVISYAVFCLKKKKIKKPKNHSTRASTTH